MRYKLAKVYASSKKAITESAGYIRQIPAAQSLDERFLDPTDYKTGPLKFSVNGHAAAVAFRDGYESLVSKIQHSAYFTNTRGGRDLAFKAGLAIGMLDVAVDLTEFFLDSVDETKAMGKLGVDMYNFVNGQDRDGTFKHEITEIAKGIGKDALDDVKNMMSKDPFSAGRSTIHVLGSVIATAGKLAKTSQTLNKINHEIKAIKPLDAIAAVQAKMLEKRVLSLDPDIQRQQLSLWKRQARIHTLRQRPTSMSVKQYEIEF